MAATERITMTMRELDRSKVIQDVADASLSCDVRRITSQPVGYIRMTSMTVFFFSLNW
jgi:hypothetical protein